MRVEHSHRVCCESINISHADGSDVGSVVRLFTWSCVAVQSYPRKPQLSTPMKFLSDYQRAGKHSKPAFRARVRSCRVPRLHHAQLTESGSTTDWRACVRACVPKLMTRRAIITPRRDPARHSGQAGLWLNSAPRLPPRRCFRSQPFRIASRLRSGQTAAQPRILIAGASFPPRRRCRGRRRHAMISARTWPFRRQLLPSALHTKHTKHSLPVPTLTRPDNNTACLANVVHG